MFGRLPERNVPFVVRHRHWVDGAARFQVIDFDRVTQEFEKVGVAFEGMDMSFGARSRCEMHGIKSDVGTDVDDDVAGTNRTEHPGIELPLIVTVERQRDPDRKVARVKEDPRSILRAGYGAVVAKIDRAWAAERIAHPSEFGRSEVAVKQAAAEAETP